MNYIKVKPIVQWIDADSGDMIEGPPFWGGRPIQAKVWGFECTICGLVRITEMYGLQRYEHHIGINRREGLKHLDQHAAEAWRVEH